jgi:pimeloyl-ACP methyl ester carboxylesterase
MDIETTYDAAGPSKAPAIVFLHGMRVTRRMWKLQFEQLARTFRVVALDLPGHGAYRELNFSLDEAIRQIAKVMDHEGLDKAVILGLSLGGYVAMEFGASFPHRAARLVVASACVEPGGWYNVPYRIFGFFMRRAPEKWMGWMSSKFFELVYPPERSALLTDPGFFMRGAAEALRELFQRKFQEKIASFPGPILFLNGKYDLGFRMHEGRFLAAAQKGKLQIIPRAFHLSNLDQPEAFSNAVERFVKPVS